LAQGAIVQIDALLQAKDCGRAAAEVLDAAEAEPAAQRAARHQPAPLLDHSIPASATP
jgi:phosphoglycerate dehydrogenase-like enzyme